MLTDLVNVLGRRIADSIDLIEKDQAIRAVTATLDAARELLSASKAEVYLVGPSEVQNAPDDVLSRLACSPRKEEEGQEPLYDRKPNYPISEKGVWQYVYRMNRPIWVVSPNHNRSITPDEESTSAHHGTETDLTAQTGYCAPIKNQICGHIIPALYNFGEGETVITIPFKKKIEGSGACWGILDIEFDYQVEYNKDQYEALETLTDHISSIAWKARAWDRTKADTDRVVKTYVRWCKQLSSATLLEKTGLWIQHAFSEHNVRDKILDLFGENGTQIDVYTLETRTATLKDTSQLEIRQIIEKEHFGIVDLTRHEQIPDLLVILGLFAMKGRPCLILSSKDSGETIPSIVRLIGQQGEKLLHVYEYDVVGKDVIFFSNGVEVEKTTGLQEFLQSVRKQSETFCIARDHVSRKKNSA